MSAALTESGSGSSESTARQPGQTRPPESHRAPSRGGRPGPDPDTERARLGWLDIRGWGIRPKLIVIVLIPTIAALFLCGLRMENSVGVSASYSRLDGLAKVLPQVNATVGQLQTERDITTGVMTAPQNSDVTNLTSLRASTDSAIGTLRDRIASVDSSRDSSLRSNLRDIVDKLNGLGDLRSAADDGREDSATVADGYTAIIASML